MSAVNSEIQEILNKAFATCDPTFWKYNVQENKLNLEIEIPNRVKVLFDHFSQQMQGKEGLKALLPILQKAFERELRNYLCNRRYIGIKNRLTNIATTLDAVLAKDNEKNRKAFIDAINKEINSVFRIMLSVASWACILAALTAGIGFLCSLNLDSVDKAFCAIGAPCVVLIVFAVTLTVVGFLYATDFLFGKIDDYDKKYGIKDAQETMKTPEIQALCNFFKDNTQQEKSECTAENKAVA